jgi:roadblock/LC7 domain-containing protein
MKRFILAAFAVAVLAVAFAPSAFADNVPTRTQVTNATSTAATWTVPNYENGSLLHLQAYDASDAVSTVTVTKVVAAAGSRTLTNTVATLVTASSGATFVCTNEWIVPGDIVRVTMTGNATGSVVITRAKAAP